MQESEAWSVRQESVSAPCGFRGQVVRQTETQFKMSQNNATGKNVHFLPLIIMIIDIHSIALVSSMGLL